MTDLGQGQRRIVTVGTNRPPKKYDRRTLTYANSFDQRWRKIVVKTVEWLTGKITIIRRIRRFEQMGAPTGQAFWPGTMKAMGIELRTPQAQIDNIPAEGPVVLVANHPHGLIDGMILADLIGRRRNDYRILSRSNLIELDKTAESYMISVPFPDDPDAQRMMVEMRAKAMDFLSQNGLIALFPSGVVASSDSWWGPAIEREWNVFTAKMIRKSGARVVPCFFPGANSRAYQIANRIGPLARQSLLVHEVVHSFDKPQAPVIGKPLDPALVDEKIQDPRAFMAWLRAHVMGLADNPDAV